MRRPALLSFCFRLLSFCVSRAPCVAPSCAGMAGGLRHRTLPRGDGLRPSFLPGPSFFRILPFIEREALAAPAPARRRAARADARARFEAEATAARFRPASRRSACARATFRLHSFCIRLHSFCFRLTRSQAEAPKTGDFDAPPGAPEPAAANADCGHGNGPRIAPRPVSVSLPVPAGTSPFPRPVDARAIFDGDRAQPGARRRRRGRRAAGRRSAAALVAERSRARTRTATPPRLADAPRDREAGRAQPATASATGDPANLSARRRRARRGKRRARQRLCFASPFLRLSFLPCTPQPFFR